MAGHIKLLPSEPNALSLTSGSHGGWLTSESFPLTSIHTCTGPHTCWCSYVFSVHHTQHTHTQVNSKILTLFLVAVTGTW